MPDNILVVMPDNIFKTLLLLIFIKLFRFGVETVKHIDENIKVIPKNSNK